MRYLCSTLLLIFMLLGPLASAANGESAKRRGAKTSSLSSVRKKQKFNRKPNVYSAKRNRPLVAKKEHWWKRK